MKEKIHPKFTKAEIKCACGATFATMSTVAQMRIDVCSQCHPAFTGEERFVDTLGRVERFQRKYTSKAKES
ncbi:50S ribosomal protein L31 [Candidatus Acetothermia bacterium]|nr:50S ribosomal protein L31 [Candidatus Acetothermia bacterium]MCI2426059.1 50S ribosomal protein L31 [Candidatus Acetothermia bacterium]MCI2427666.1 50S ribosomal protein L31 [Candidatus Acetothermia bacterium]MCI2428816.1 50S ribosomal protein L31 [Candidatus Acetothermia bacterium]